MGDAAQGEPRQHEVFTTPFKVKPVFESWPTPGNYRGYPGGKDLPAKTKVWRIQNTGKDFGGVASYSYGFEDSPDAEILTAGFNVGKESGAVGVGRHGNFLQWGFSAPPSQMTEPGRQFFLNCICYIHKFDGVRPIVREQSSDRLTAVHLAMLMNRIKDLSFRTNTFPPELLAKFKDDSDGMARYYQDHFELIYYQRGFHIDEDLQGLGLKSNRKVETLQRVTELLGDPARAAAARKVLGRYTRESFETPDEWQAWFKQSHDRLFFSDVGGYKFFVRPKDYPLRPQAVSTLSGS